MRATWTKVIVGGLLLCLAPATASGWWDTGHRIVALVAWARMDAPTRSRVLAVLRKHPQAKRYFTPPRDLPGGERRRQLWVITQAAVWSDLVRKTDRDRPTWHYVNRPLFVSDAHRRRLSGRLTTNLAVALPPKTTLDTQPLNVIQAIALCRRQLVGNDVSDPDKALCVVWLCHLVGDVHQPCHTTAIFTPGRFPKGDRGGNDIPLVGRTAGSKQKKRAKAQDKGKAKDKGKLRGINLHMFWDGQFGGSRSFGNDVERQAAVLGADRRLQQAGLRAAGQLDARVWVDESHRLAREVAYHDVILKAVRDGERATGKEIPAIRLPADYARRVRQVAEQRVVEAGYRLARVLAELK